MQVINTPPSYEGITQYKFNTVDNNAAVKMKLEREAGNYNLSSLETWYEQVCNGYYFRDNNVLAPVYRWYASKCDIVA